MSNIVKVDWGVVFAESFVEVYDSKVAKAFRFILILFCLLLAVVTVGWLAVDVFKTVFMGASIELLMKPVILLVVCETLFPVLYVGTIVCAVLAVGIRKAYLIYKGEADEQPAESEKKEEAK